ncbi:MAG: T9SS type A sorting domain-containing protein [Bacteroidetes bacterium]|nr:T9SS type A sorting domain-containing protein [Bacteroidota bacterium]
MRQDASISRDTYDYMRVPRFIRYVDMSFAHPEDYNQYFSRDVVPVSEYYEWDLDIETNVGKEPVEISWDNSYFGNGQKKLLLFDLAEQKIIDLSQQSNYKFPGEKRSFKIFYGSLEVLEGKIRPTTVYLGKSYPNPFTSSAIIPFTLPENVGNFNVRLEIFDILGSKIYVLTDRSFEAGFHTIEWNGTGSRGQSVDSGFYIIVMKVTSEHTGAILSQKILKR